LREKCIRIQEDALLPAGSTTATGTAATADVATAAATAATGRQYASGEQQGNFQNGIYQRR
jgi:hypothetical protein